MQIFGVASENIKELQEEAASAKCTPYYGIIRDIWLNFLELFPDCITGKTYKDDICIGNDFSGIVRYFIQRGVILFSVEIYCLEIAGP